MTNDKKRGRIKTVNSRGFGFITDENDIDYFFHYTAFSDNWKKLVASHVAKKELFVEFDVDESATEAPRAINVRLV